MIPPTSITLPFFGAKLQRHPYEHGTLRRQRRLTQRECENLALY